MTKKGGTTTYKIELLARAVIVKNDRVLIAHSIGASNTFLPGGHVQRGESMKIALVRELEEELGKQAEVGMYLGAVEHTWLDDAGMHHEINHCFSVDLPGLHADNTIESHEPYLEFFWVKLTELHGSNLEPAPLRRLLANLMNRTTKLWWESNL